MIYQEVVDEPLTPEEQTDSDLASVPGVSGTNAPRLKLANTGNKTFNLSSHNFTGLANNEIVTVRAIEIYDIICASVGSQVVMAVMNGFALQISTWTLSATWQTSSVQSPQFSARMDSRLYLA